MKNYPDRLTAYLAVSIGLLLNACVAVSLGLFMLHGGSIAAEPQGPQYWLVKVVPGTTPSVEVVDDYESAEDCWNDTFWDNTVDKPALAGDGVWSACVALNEPAELALAKHILRAMGELK